MRETSGLGPGMARRFAGLFAPAPRVSGMRLAAIALSLAALLPVAAPAAEKPPPELAKVRAAFAVAVKAKDLAAIEALVAFPLANEVYQEPQTIAKAAFRKKLSEYAELATCLAGEPLTPDADTAKTSKLWLVDCNGIEFFFGLRGGKWLHVKFGNVNE